MGRRSNVIKMSDYISETPALDESMKIINKVAKDLPKLAKRIAKLERIVPIVEKEMAAFTRFRKKYEGTTRAKRKASK